MTLAVETEKILSAIDAIRAEIAAQNQPWLSVREASQYLGVSRSTLRNLIRAGKLKKYKVGGVVRIHRRDLDSLVVFSKPYRKLLKNQRDTIKALE